MSSVYKYETLKQSHAAQYSIFHCMHNITVIFFQLHAQNVEKVCSTSGYEMRSMSTLIVLLALIFLKDKIHYCLLDQMRRTLFYLLHVATEKLANIDITRFIRLISAPVLFAC